MNLIKSMTQSSTSVRTWTVLEILQWTATYLNKHQVESPRLTAELMLCEVLQVERLKLYMDFERLLSPAELKSFRSMIERRVQKREPLQYILGHTNFFGCNLLVDSRVLIPRPETEQLVELSMNEIRRQNLQSVMDIGTGSGCIAIALAKHCPGIQVIAVDRSEDALQLASENATRNHLTNIRFEQWDVLAGDWVGESVDLVVSNPPYVSISDYSELEPELSNHEPRIALTDESDGLVFYRRFASVFPKLLREDGQFFCEIGFGSEANIRAVFSDYDVQIHDDYSGIPRIAKGRVKPR